MLINKQKSHVVSKDEEKRYLLAAPQPLHDIAIIMLDSGMRPREVYMLEKENEVTSEKSLGLQTDDFVLIDGQEGKTRKFYLSERASALLQSRMERFAGSHHFSYKDGDTNQTFLHTNGLTS